MPMTPKSAKMPVELMALSEESDDALSEGLIALIPAPERPYNPKVVSALSNAVASAAKLMGVDVMAETYLKPVTELDPDLVRFLAMITKAADDFGQPLPVRLEDIKGDAELTALTAGLIKLARDRDFKAFLAEEAPEPEMEQTEEVESENAEPFNFASRMR